MVNLHQNYFEAGQLRSSFCYSYVYLLYICRNKFYSAVAFIPHYAQPWLADGRLVWANSRENSQRAVIIFLVE